MCCKERISNMMATAWTDFAKTRNPDPESSLNWREYTQVNQQKILNVVLDYFTIFFQNSKSCLLLQAEPAIENEPYPERMLIWRKLVWDPILISSAPKPKPVCPSVPSPPPNPSSTQRPSQSSHSFPAYRPQTPSRPFLVPYFPAWIHPYPTYSHYHPGR